jgi:uncharacterized protein DUF11
MLGRVVLAAAAVSGTLPAGARASDASVRPRGAAGPLGTERLSDERTLSRWAYADQLGWARRDPSPSAGRVARLRGLTEDGQPEVYLALRSRRDAHGRVWIQVRCRAGRMAPRAGFRARTSARCARSIPRWRSIAPRCACVCDATGAWCGARASGSARPRRPRRPAASTCARSLNVGDKATITVTVPAGTPGRHTNRVAAVSSTGDPNLNNNAAAATLTVRRPAVPRFTG